MKKIFGLFLLLSSVFTGVSAQQQMVLEGTYQGQNLYVQNPFASFGVGFCVVNVTVNGQQSTDEINSSAFEIDFASYQLTKGAGVEVKIEYKDDCSPRVLNPDVLIAASTFIIASMEVTPDGLFSFSTKNESGELPFVIEQKRWNKWVKVGQVNGKGLSSLNKYSLKLQPHSGNNTFRIKQVDFSKKPRYSQEKRLIRSSTKEIFIANENTQKINSQLIFADEGGVQSETMYEVWSEHGMIVKKGYGKVVDLTSLDRGVYFVNYDSKQGKIRKI